jgi:hypothetical protein
VPIVILTVALDTDAPDRSQILNSPLAGPADALLIAQTLASLQGQLLAAAAAPAAAAPTPPADAGAPAPKPARTPRGKSAARVG